MNAGLRATITSASLLSLIACGASEPDWRAQQLPQAEAALADHLPRLSAALALVPPSPSAMSCSRPEPSLPRRAVRPQETSAGLLVVQRERAADIVARSLPLLPTGEETYREIESGPYHRLFQPMSGDGFADSYAALRQAGHIAIVLTESMDAGLVENQTITRPASFTGWAVVVALDEPRVVAQLRLQAESASTVMIRSQADLDLTASLVAQLFADLDAKLAAACPADVVTPARR